jgi:protein-S-isoprenylcysteine O-methyltransferase Ste14
VLHKLRFLGWLVCAVYSTIPAYWLMIHPRAGYWRAQARSPYRVLLPGWAVILTIVLLSTARWRRILLYENNWAWIGAVVLFTIGAWLYKAGGANFGLKQLQGTPELSRGHGEQRLVTSGIRSCVRHPVYLAHLCEMLAWSIGTGLVVCHALTMLSIITGAIMIRSEDSELEERFGELYREYREQVPAVIPRLCCRGKANLSG